MSILVFIFLGLVQGATEFLPISSTGHLIVFESFFKLPSSSFGLIFDVSLHLGTLIAVLIYFWHDLIKIFWGVLKSFYNFRIKTESEKLGWLVVVSSIPAAIAGFMFSDIISVAFRSPMLVAFMLFLVSLYFIYSERRAKHHRDVGSINFSDALTLGIAQAFALIPGTSRSGIVISSAMILGLKRVEASRFAFLMAVPTIFGAALKELLPFIIHPSSFPTSELIPFTLGTISAAISGLFAIKFLLKFLSKHSLLAFVVYRYTFAFLIIFLFLYGLLG